MRVPLPTLRPTLLCAALALQGGWAAVGAPAHAQESPLALIRGRVSLSVGDAFGPEESSFGRISSVVGTPDGRIVVADVQSSDIRIFGADGGYQFTAARPGQGPGEVQGPCCLAFSSDGHLWIRDTGNARYVVLALDASAARAVRTVRMEHGHAGMWAPISFSGDTLVDVGAETEPEVGPAVRRFFRTRQGEVARVERGDQPTVAELGHLQVTTSSALLYITPPFAAEYLAAHGPGGVWAEAVTSGSQVRLHRRGGGVTSIETGVSRGPLLSASERAWAEQLIARERRRARGQRIELEVPDRKQPVEAIFFDDAGRLWVQRTTAEGEDEWADVYDGAGRLVERRTWPAGIEIGRVGWAGGRWSLGVRRDEYDVEQVIRIEWGPG